MGPTIRFAKLLTRPARLTRLLPALVLAISALPAGGQIERIDPGTASSTSLTGAQRQAVTDFIAAHGPRALGEDPRAAAQALDELLSPLRDSDVSVAFRQAMAEGLWDQMAGALADERVMIEKPDGSKTINTAPYAAMRLAGEIATENTLSMLREQLSSKDPGRRFFAIYGTEVVLYSIASAAPAVTPRALLTERSGGSEGLIPELGRMIESDESPRHAAAAVRALAEAVGIRDDQFQPAARAALIEIGRGTSDRMKRLRDETPTDEERLVALSAGQSVFRSIAQGGSPSSSEAGRAAVRLAGHMIASVYRDLETGRLPPPDQREGEGTLLQRQMLQLARNLLIFGDRAYASAPGRGTSANLEAAASRLLDAFEGRGDQNLRRVALDLISANGLLTAAPYGFDDDEFIAD